MDLAGCRSRSAWHWGSPDCQLLGEEKGRLRRSRLMAEGKFSLLSTKAFPSTILHPSSASSGSRGKKALAWQLHTGGLCFSLGEQERVVEYVLSHWSLVQIYFKACGSQQGSYVSLLIFTSIQSTLSESTQWNLYRVINRPQLSGFPLPCSKSFLPFPGYTWHSWILCLIFPLTTIHFFLRKKERFLVLLGHWLNFSSSLSFFPRAHREVDCQMGSRRRESRQNRALHLQNLLEICSQIFTNLYLLDIDTFFQHSALTIGSFHINFMLSVDQSTHGQTRRLCWTFQDTPCGWMPRSPQQCSYCFRWDEDKAVCVHCT